MPWYKRTKRRKIRIPKNLFDCVVKHDDVKELLVKTLRARKPTHVLLVGPPASAKSLMLLEISRLPYSYYLLGGRTTKAGLSWLLMQEQPKYLLIDELDKMKQNDMVILLSLMETGLVRVVKYRKKESLVLKTNVYAACNSDAGIPSELLSRFHFKLYFTPYSLEEFIEVAETVLEKREGVSTPLASYIIHKVAKYSRDIRDCIGISRLAANKNDVDRIINTLKKYRRKAPWLA